MEKKGERDEEYSAHVLHMRGGTGPGSYNDFSNSLQSNLAVFYQPKLSQAIANACSKLLTQCFFTSDAGAACFAIADFGCSCAWSTIRSMHFIADCVFAQASSAGALTNASQDLPANRQLLHIQGFFNDLPSNDFNTLFSNLLSGSSTSSPQAAGFHFMPCGLPGSFYSRLFPSGYLHIGLCTLALHNLSKVPEVVQDRNSPAWNENGVWILEGSKIETVMAYKKQYVKDFTCFLQHRSQELVPGGLLFCVMIAAESAGKTLYTRLEVNNLYRNLQVAWRQLVSEGLLEQRSLDAFNLPLFIPTLDEVKEVVYGDALQMDFEVVEVEYVEVERAPMQVWKENAAADAQTWGSTCETMVRNFVGSLIQPHLGPTKFELLMERLRQVGALDDEMYRTSIIRVIVLALSRR